MLSWRRGMVSLLVVLLLAWGAGHPHLFAEGIEDLKKGVVKITARVEGQQAKVGTGFIVSAEDDAAYIVTASHVIGSDPQPEVEFFTKPHQSFKAKVIATEGAPDNGLAALIVQLKVPKGTVVLGLDVTSRFSGGEAVSSIGFPRRREPWAVTSGFVSGIKNRHITVQAPIEEGNSGGPLLFNGRVVGVVTQNTGFFGQAEPAATLQLFLHSSRVPIDDVREEGRAEGSSKGQEDDTIFDEPISKKSGPTKAAVDITGTWVVPGEPAYQYLFKQTGRAVTMTQIMTVPMFGSQTTAYAEGEIEGRHIELMYLNAQGGGGIVLDVLEDGRSMQGIFSLGMVPLRLFLEKRGN